MTLTIIVVLLIIGFLFLLLEILVLPGTGISGLIGFVLIAIGIWQAYAVLGTRAGTFVLIGSVILSIVSLSVALKSGTWKKASLSSSIDSRVNVVETDKVKVGDSGRTISRLAPMGKALINGIYWEVRSNGALIDENSEVEVIKIENNKIIVKLKTT
jgi:membrane-bound ClpP family serine protease